MNMYMGTLQYVTLTYTVKWCLPPPK